MKQPLIATCTVLLAGCAHFRAPDEGGAPWWRIGADHFRVETDAEEAAARAYTIELERVYAAMLEAGWGGEDPGRPPIHVVLFRSVKELHELASRDGARQRSYTSVSIVRIAAFAVRDEQGRVIWVTSADVPLRESDALIEALALYAARPFRRSLPFWAADGMGSFLAQGRLDGDAFIVGELSDSAVRAPPVKVAYLRNPRRQIHSVVEQPTALILLHYLRFEHRDGLRDFARRVSAGEPEDDAFAAAFPEVTAAGLEDSVTQLRSHPQSHPVAVPLGSYENAPRMESMNGAEVRGLWDFLQRTTARLR